MRPIDLSSHALFRSAMLLLLVVPPSLPASQFLVNVHGSAETLAFARYIAATERRDPFQQYALILIEGSLPALYKEADVVAFRIPGAQGPSYSILGVEGDGAVVEEVIARYFLIKGEVEKQPRPSITITPANYKFHLAGEVRTGESSAYIYRIDPKKSRPGLVAGKVWIDSKTGTEVTLSGRVKKTPFIGGQADVVRETKLENGAAYARVTHVAFTLPKLGRAELVITEYLLPQAEGVPGGQGY